MINTNLYDFIHLLIVDFDSCCKSHNLRDIFINRKLYSMCSSIIDFVIHCEEIGFISLCVDIDKRFYKSTLDRLFYRRKKLDNFYYIKG